MTPERLNDASNNLSVLIAGNRLTKQQHLDVLAVIEAGCEALSMSTRPPHNNRVEISDEQCATSEDAVLVAKSCRVELERTGQVQR